MIRKIFNFVALFNTVVVSAQISVFPYAERFDTSVAPKLPAGWSTSTVKNPTGDFVTSSSSPRSGSLPNCLSTTDARTNQFVISPSFSFEGTVVDSLEFYERRTGTFTAGLLLEASLNGDSLFSIKLSDTLTLSPSNNGIYQRRVISLPDTLSGQENVRLRWRVSGRPGSGGTAVLRLEDITITVKKQTDLAITSITILPQFPRSGEDVTVSLDMTNRALLGNLSGTIELYDSLTLVASKNFSHFFSPNEFLSAVLVYTHVTAGRHPLTLLLRVDGDEDTTNNIRPFHFNVGVRQRSVLINEVMYSPLSGMPEWVELVNNSMDTVLLTGWKISDAGATKALIGGTRTFLPYTYAVITTDSNAFKSFYENAALLYEAAFSALNNGGDAVILYDQFGFVVDSVTFRSSWGGGVGNSLERIDTSFTLFGSTSWSSSRHTDGATPGVINSVTKKQFDAAVSHISITPQFPDTRSVIAISSTIINTGRQILPSLRIIISIDVNDDSVFTPDEVRNEQTVTQLPPGDSTTVLFFPEQLTQGTHHFSVAVASAQEEDSTNNLLRVSLYIGVPPSSIVISEIMYAPVEEIPEWIEVFNTEANTIDISGWTISDNGSTKAPLVNSSAFIAARSYGIITVDSIQFTSRYSGTVPVFQSAFSSLNNTTPDAVVFRDSRGIVMDSVRYQPHWGGGNGFSLQRYDLFASSNDSANWHSVASTAGGENEISRKDVDVEIRRIESLNHSNGIRITIALFNRGRITLNGVIVRLFYDKNLDSIPHQDELLTSLPVPSVLPLDSVSVSYDWTMALHGREHILVLTEHPEDQQIKNNFAITSVNKSFQWQTVVINEIMYEPLSGHSEFVELLNRSADTIDIADWTLMDQPGTAGNRVVIPLSLGSKAVPPGGYLLIASDSSIFTQVSSLIGTSIIVHPSLSLNNNGEDLVLTDLTGTPIDSLRYSPLWHMKHLGAGNRSLERIDPHVKSNDQRNWSSSVAKNGATPLQQNSIFLRSVALSAAISLHPNPFSPDQDGFEDFLSINYSLPAGSSTIRVRIFDVAGRLLRRLVQNEPSASSGSVIWNGLDDDGNRVRIGMYIIFLEALDHFGGTAKTMKDVAVVARKLH